MSTAAVVVKSPVVPIPVPGRSDRPLSREQRDTIIVAHLPLVRAIAARVRENLPVQVELDDLAHAGVLGLFDAVEKYDPSKGVVFHLYAKHRIRGAILDSLRQLDWASRDLRKRYKHIEALTQKLGHQLGRVPNEAELAAAMGVGLARWRKLVQELHAAGLSPNQSHWGGNFNETPEHFAPADTPQSAEELPDESCARRQLHRVLATAMGDLPARYRRVINLYYGRGATMKQIGGELGVNESRVSQIHKAALEKLSLALRNRGFENAEMFVDA
jgi:RNA polymerase sigma factor for flagellar operon FliA